MEVDCKNLALEFSNRYLNLLDQKRTIDLDIKELKQEYDEQGLATKVVVKAINSLKKEKKETISQQDELAMFKEWLSENKEVDDKICALATKKNLN